MRDESDNLTQQIAALQAALRLPLPDHIQALNQAALNELLTRATVLQSNRAFGNVVARDLVQTITVQQFFNQTPAPDELELLADYLRSVQADCERLRLDRLTAKQQDGQEQAVVPASMTLSDVYTALATDEEITISRHPRCIILPKLRARLDERSADLVPAERVRSALLAKPNLHDLHDDERVIVGLYRPELVLEAIARERRLVLLGDPGSGKSTALRYLAAALADALLANRAALPLRGWRDRTLPIPLLCPLGLVAAEIEQTGARPVAALWRVLERMIEGDGIRSGLLPYIRGAMRRGAVIVLFDGLDEIPVQSNGQPLRAIIAQALRDFERQVPAATLVVTCRIRPYRELAAWQLREQQGWTERMLAPWAFGQVRRFINRWYAATADRDPILSADEATTRAAALITALEASERVRRLTESPLLATMLALVHLNRKTLPEDRAELYHECVELLLDRWEPQRSWAAGRLALLERLAIPNLKREDLRAVLHRIAYAAHEQPSSADGRGLVDGDQLEGQLFNFFKRLKVAPSELATKQAIFLGALREETGLLHDLDGVYALPHLTFEEYLAACHLADDPDMVRLAYERWTSADRERWREVLLLMMGRLRQQGKAAQKGIGWVKFLAQPRIRKQPKTAEQRQRDSLFAAECYAEMGGTAALVNSTEDIDEIEQKLADGLAAILDTVPSILALPERIRAGELLGPLGDPRLLNPETGNSRDGKYWCGIEGGKFWFDPHPLSVGELELRSLSYPFKIGRFSVTQSEYSLFVAANGYTDSDLWSKNGWKWIGSLQEGDYFRKKLELIQPSSLPMEYISWYESMAYCNWLTNMGHQEGWLPFDNIIRLPTYQEWERTARGIDKRTYPWGDAYDGESYANIENIWGSPTPVGCFAQGSSANGVVDLIGNIAVWTSTNKDLIEELQPTIDDAHEELYVLHTDFVEPLSPIGAVICTNNPQNETEAVGFRLVMAPRTLPGDNEE